MKVLFHLGHPAHFHLFKNVILDLEKRKHKINILIKKKDILEDLLKDSDIPYKNILPEGRKDSKVGIIIGQIKQVVRLGVFCLQKRPELLIGSVPTVAQVGALLGITSINLSEDDAEAVSLFAKTTYPFSSVILAPDTCNNGKWEYKSIKYKGYHELAYLHPNHFKPDINIVKRYIATDKPFFIIRFSKLNAYHDTGISGISLDVAKNIVEILKPYGNIFITSEKELVPELEKFRINIKPLDIHHFLHYAKLYIGDSQTMAAEAGVLGTPFIRINDFVGRLGYLDELENKYKLGYGIKPDKIGHLIPLVESLLSNKNLKNEWKKKQNEMLKDKIDVTNFLMWFVENYPESINIMKANPDYQYNFK
jgi:predicted glycosyltransferase